jgi:hypothetical protein
VLVRYGVRTGLRIVAGDGKAVGRNVYLLPRGEQLSCHNGLRMRLSPEHAMVAATVAIFYDDKKETNGRWYIFRPVCMTLARLSRISVHNVQLLNFGKIPLLHMSEC